MENKKSIKIDEIIKADEIIKKWEDAIYHANMVKKIAGSSLLIADSSLLISLNKLTNYLNAEIKEIKNIKNLMITEGCKC